MYPTAVGHRFHKWPFFHAVIITVNPPLCGDGRLSTPRPTVPTTASLPAFIDISDASHRKPCLFDRGVAVSKTAKVWGVNSERFGGGVKTLEVAPFSHHTWLGFWQTVHPDHPRVTAHWRMATHCLMFMSQGWASGRWISRGREFHAEGRAGAVRFSVADGEQHTMIATASGDMRFYTLFIPPSHLVDIAADEGMNLAERRGDFLCPDDAVLQSCISSLASSHSSDDSVTDLRKDAAARRLVLRLAELTLGRSPEWTADCSVFDSRTVEYLIAHIDATLRIGPSLSDMAQLVGLSPSHFAKKFRQTVGLSLHRFIFHRRLAASLEMLKSDSAPLAHVAYDLGFASQSHFTRLFSERTGMTPAKYRKQHKPTVG
jgi:AraC-like DNA-binding protein